jgi:hypothetical protein
MSKGQQKSNKEVRKPKQDKKAKPAAASPTSTPLKNPGKK